MKKPVMITTVKNPQHSNCVGNKNYKVVWDYNCYMVCSKKFALWIDPRDVAEVKEI